MNSDLFLRRDFYLRAIFILHGPSGLLCLPPIIYHLESSHTITYAVVLVYGIKSVLCIYSVAICIVYRTEEKVNHVLLFTVLNPVYPITVVSMSAIWSFTPRMTSVSLSTLYILITIYVNGFLFITCCHPDFASQDGPFQYALKYLAHMQHYFSTSHKTDVIQIL